MRWNETPDGIGWYKNLIAFINTTRWFELTANDALIGGGAVGRHCLANAGKEYLVLVAGGGSGVLSIAGAAAPLAAEWVDLYTAKVTNLATQGNGARPFTNPYSDPALLWVRDPMR